MHHGRTASAPTDVGWVKHRHGVRANPPKHHKVGGFIPISSGFYPHTYSGTGWNRIQCPCPVVTGLVIEIVIVVTGIVGKLREDILYELPGDLTIPLGTTYLD